MNPEIKQKWIEALTSGEYEQGKAYLRIEGKYCCLGVLCDLYAKETGQGSWERDLEIAGLSFTTTNSESFKVLPEEVINWAELDSEDPLVKEHYGRKYNISYYNDMGRSFTEIASLIEEEL